MDECPPPPPSTPPPPLETTIGKYIARFRYEKPQPREARAAAQRSDFWWTKSPRFSPSPSPPSTWASGGAFRFPETESDSEESEEEQGEKKGQESRKEEDAESVDSVESKLRRRLGVWSSDSGQEKEEKRELETHVNVSQSWDSVEWSLEAEEEEGGEDPEQVIARVRKRLGWGDTPSSVAYTTGSRKWKPIELKLSVNGEEKRSETSLGRQLKIKPPLSPGSFRRGRPLEALGGSSWSSGGREDVTLSMSSAEDKESREPTEEKVEEELRSVPIEMPPLNETDTRLNSSCTLVNSSDSLQHSAAVYPSAEKRLDASCMSVNSSRLDESTDFQDISEEVTPENESSVAMGIKEEASSLSECKADGETDDEPQRQIQERSAAEVVEVPLLPTSSPARPEPVPGNAAASSNSSSSSSHRSNSSSRGQSERVSIETKKTLDNLVSLVVHSWGNDFFSESAVEQGSSSADTAFEDGSANNWSQSRADGVFNAASSPGSSSVTLPSPAKSIGETKESSATYQDPTAAELHTETAPSTTVLQADTSSLSLEDSTLLEKDEEEEEKEDCEVPGEDDDQIVQMLLERIALLEAALRQIDDS